MEKVTVVFIRLPNRKFAPETEVRQIFERELGIYGPVVFDGSWIMSCGPYGAGFFHKFRVGFETSQTLHALIELCEKPIHGFVGAVMQGDDIRFEMTSPLMITGSAIEEVLSAADDLFTKEEIEEARVELYEMNDRLMGLEYENRVMRALLGLEADENPMGYQGGISPIL